MWLQLGNMGTSNSPLVDDLSTRFQLSILVRILGCVRSAQQALIKLKKVKVSRAT